MQIEDLRLEINLNKNKENKMKKSLKDLYKRSNSKLEYPKWLEDVLDQTNENHPIRISKDCIILSKKYTESKEYKNLFKEKRKVQEKLITETIESLTADLTFPDIFKKKDPILEIQERSIIRFSDKTRERLSEMKNNLCLVKRIKSSSRWMERIVLNNSLYVTENTTESFLNNGPFRVRKYNSRADWFDKKEEYRDMTLKEMVDYCDRNGYSLHCDDSPNINSFINLSKVNAKHFRFRKPNNIIFIEFGQVKVEENGN